MADSNPFADYHSGGMDTTRIRGDQADVQRRRENARRARANLAAMVAGWHGGVQALERDEEKRAAAAEEFAGLLEMLGLNVVPDHRPGVCRRPGCGTALPITAVTSYRAAGSPHWRAGYCSAKCWAQA